MAPGSLGGRACGLDAPDCHSGTCLSMSSSARRQVVTGHCRWPAPGRINGRQQTAESALLRCAIVCHHCAARAPRPPKSGRRRCSDAVRSTSAAITRPTGSVQPTATLDSLRLLDHNRVTPRPQWTDPPAFQSATKEHTSHWYLDGPVHVLRNQLIGKNDGEDISPHLKRTKTSIPSDR